MHGQAWQNAAELPNDLQSSLATLIWSCIAMIRKSNQRGNFKRQPFWWKMKTGFNVSHTDGNARRQWTQSCLWVQRIQLCSRDPFNERLSLYFCRQRKRLEGCWTFAGQTSPSFKCGAGKKRKGMPLLSVAPLSAAELRDKPMPPLSAIVKGDQKLWVSRERQFPWCYRV